MTLIDGQAVSHVHGYVRVRRLPSLVVYVLVRVGLRRLVITSGTLPHDPECTAKWAVTRGEE